MAHLNPPPPGAAVNAIRPTSYVLIVDTDGDRIAVVVRECASALRARIVIERDGDDAIRILTQFGPPALLIAALPLPGRDGFSVIDAVCRIDDETPVIAWTADRELREYAACRLATRHAKVLGPGASPAVLRTCLHSMLGGDRGVAGGQPGSSTEIDHRAENWSELAKRAQQFLQVAGAAVYARARGEAQYRLSVVWTSEAPMPPVPELLPSVLEEVIAGGVARLWPDLVDEPKLGPPGSTFHETVRSMAIVPIRRDGETAGALCVFDSKPQALRRADVDTLTAIAGGASIPDSFAPRAVSPPPIDRDVAQVVIPRELARVRREQLSLSVILFAATPRLPHGSELPSVVTAVPVGDILARAVRGNDLVVRWTESEVLLVLTGVGGGVARRVAERVRAVVETNAANRIAVSGAVTELRTSDSFEATVARAAERLQMAVQDGHPRIA